MGKKIVAVGHSAAVLEQLLLFHYTPNFLGPRVLDHMKNLFYDCLVKSSQLITVEIVL